jgi:hypothetical protein
MSAVPDRKPRARRRQSRAEPQTADWRTAAEERIRQEFEAQRAKIFSQAHLLALRAFCAGRKDCSAFELLCAKLNEDAAARAAELAQAFLHRLVRLRCDG